MSSKLIRVGTTYIPVQDVNNAADWYVKNLEVELNYQDKEKAIINFANQSFFLVKSNANQCSNFLDCNGDEHFSLTFEVDGVDALIDLHKEMIEREVKVGDIEDRGHSGRNFVFYDLDGNMFDVWSELSPSFKEKYM